MSIAKSFVVLVSPVTLCTGALCCASPAMAEDEDAAEEAVWTLDASYKSDVVGVVAGGVARGTRYLDNLNLTAGADLGRAMGWTGARAFVNVLNNLGGRPNDLAGSIQGVNNIEVSETRLKLYEAWIEQGFGAEARGGSVRAGLYDLNSEFYQTDASGLLIAPPFGIGSELSATGPSGPSIFPSTALAVRLEAHLPNVYARAAVINAEAGTVGDEQGVDFSGREGVLVIGEIGYQRTEEQGGGKIGIGAWTYTKKQPMVAPPDITFELPPARAAGAYLVAEYPLAGTPGEGQAVSAFARLGISDGKTTPFRGGWQVGLLLDRVFAKRPASSFSIGVGTSVLSENYRNGNPAGAPALLDSETTIEATYSDEILPGLKVQPDIQYIANPSADPTLGDAVVLGLRVQFDLHIH